MWQTGEKLVKIRSFLAKLWPVYGRTRFSKGFDVMIFAAAVPPPPPPDAHYFHFTNSFRCEELIIDI